MSKPLTLEDRAEKLAKFLDFHIGEPVGNQVRGLAAAVRADERANLQRRMKALRREFAADHWAGHSTDPASCSTCDRFIALTTEPTP